MKILKIKIERLRVPGHTRYRYPPQYSPEKIIVVGYETMSQIGLKQVEDRGDKFEYLIGIVKDIDAPGFLRSEAVEEISREEALKTARHWIDQVATISDQTSVLRVLCKNALGKELVDEDLAIIDIENHVHGINQTPDFKTRLEKAIESTERAER